MSTKGDASDAGDRGRKLGDGKPAPEAAPDPAKVRAQLDRDRKRYASLRAMAEGEGATPSERRSAMSHMAKLRAKHGAAVTAPPEPVAARDYAEGPSHAAAPARDPWGSYAPPPPDPFYAPRHGEGPAGDRWNYAATPASAATPVVTTIDTRGGGFSPEARRHMRAGR